jgi:uncharacterized protein YjbI with pentapeptide repeats
MMDERETTPTAEPEEPPKSGRVLWWAGLIAALVLTAVAVVIVYGYLARPGWTGVSGKKFWDYLELLVVPAALALGLAWLNWAQRQRERAAEDIQQERELEVQNQRAQDAALEEYLKQMSQLLRDKDGPLRQSEEGDEVRSLARSWTLTVLPRLDGERKRSVLQFLYEANLIRRDACILSLREANLTKANLHGINLQRANLRGADLQAANPPSAEDSQMEERIQELRYTKILARSTVAFTGVLLLGGVTAVSSIIRQRSLGEYDLGGPNLEQIDLEGANLTGANLKGANLSGANLRGALLSNTNLFGANLEGASLQSVTQFRGPTYAMFAAIANKNKSINIAEMQKGNENRTKLVSRLRNFVRGRREADPQALPSPPNLQYLAERVRLEAPNLEEANLKGANLGQAHLVYANLKGANLEGAEDITNESLQDEAASLEGATMPNGQTYEKWLKDKEGSREDRG